MKCPRCQGLLTSAKLCEEIKYEEIYKDKLKCLICGRFFEKIFGRLIRMSPPIEWNET